MSLVFRSEEQGSVTKPESAVEPALYHPSGDGFVATPFARGPWDPRFQHGGPPAALLVGAMAAFGDDAGAFRLARLTVELLRPVPLGHCRVEVRSIRAGRTVDRLEGRLIAEDRVCLEARCLRIRRQPLAVVAGPDLARWPDPGGLEDFVFPFFEQDIGYHRAVQLRIAHGSWGSTPIGMWARCVVPLVSGRETTPLERLLILADAQSGMGVPLDPRDYTFVNPDLSVLITREPASDWLGFDVRSSASPDGTGLSESAIRDQQGAVGRSGQLLVVAQR